MINVDKLYELMTDRGFQEPRTGNLFFPAYIYTYPPEREYEFRGQIKLMIEKLKRPNHFLDCLVVNIYEELIDYLKNETFAGQSIFDEIMEMKSYDETFDLIRDEIDNNNFYEYFEKKVKDHFKPDQKKRVFLVVYGFGSSFPYIRASEFLKKTERLIKEFKVILFYPGEYKNSNYSLFGILNDDNMYRANNLNLQLEE
jgi:hypothetical protein